MQCLECDNEAIGITRYCVEHHADNWHGWFAWHPVKTSDLGWIWMKTVLRKKIPANSSYLAQYLVKYWYSSRDDW